MSREDMMKCILDKRDDKNKIDLLSLYPIIDKAFEEMQLIIYEKEKIIKDNVSQIRELQEGIKNGRFN